MKHIITILLSLTVAVRVHAAMVRVVEVRDARTLIIERDGAREPIRLAGVEIVDASQAAESLRWTVGTSWVLAEKQSNGEYFVYRSPDALFINRELVVRGFARATLPGIEPEVQLRVTYLGQWNPAESRVSTSTSPRSDKRTSPRSSDSRAPKTRSSRRPASASRAPAAPAKKPS